MKKCLAIILCLVMIFTFAACGNSDGDAGQEVFEITWAGTLPDEHPFNQAIYDHIEELEEATDGRVTVKLFPNNQLGDSRSNLEQMQQNGSVQMGEMSGAVLAGFTDMYSALSLPFLFDDLDQALAFMQSDYAVSLEDRLAEEVGVRPLYWVYNDSRTLTNSVRPVDSPDDMNGLKIRVMESDVYLETFEALGASPITMSFAEVFSGLQQGTIDGQDNGAAITVSNRFYEVQDYFTDLNHVIDMAPVLISEDYWQSMPEDCQQALREFVKNVCDENTQTVYAQNEEYIDEISQYCEVTRLTDEQRAAFRDACQGVYDWFAATYPNGGLDEILAALEEL